MPDLRRALLEAGAHPTGFTRGDIWQVPNEAVRLDVDMHRGDEPAEKARLVVIVDRNELCRDEGALTSLIVPLTSDLTKKRATSVVLPASTPGLVEDSLAQVHLVQPVARKYFRDGELLGRLHPEQIADILIMLAWAVGIVSEEPSIP